MCWERSWTRSLRHLSSPEQCTLFGGEDEIKMMEGHKWDNVEHIDGGIEGCFPEGGRPSRECTRAKTSSEIKIMDLCIISSLVSHFVNPCNTVPSIPCQGKSFTTPYCYQGSTQVGLLTIETTPPFFSWWVSSCSQASPPTLINARSCQSSPGYDEWCEQTRRVP